MKIAAWRCLAIVACALASGSACAQVRDFPNRPVRIMVPSAPGAILDLVARVMGPPMADIMGQSVVVDNRPGAGTNIGMEIVAALNGYIRKAMPASGMAERFASEGANVGASTPEQFSAHIRTELARWSKVIKDLGLRTE